MAITKELIKLVPLLEKMSLVEFASNGVQRLEEAINLADQLCDVNTEGVKPMISPIESTCTRLRDDTYVDTPRQSITRNAYKMIEDYFVAPIITTKLSKTDSKK